MHMDHRALIASLSAEERSRLTARSNLPGLAHLALHWAAIFCLGALIAARVPLWPLIMLPQGVLIVFLFTSLHEAIHGTAFASERLNRAAARAASLPLLLPADWFRYFHFAHHRFTQNPDNDPELSTPKPGTALQYAAHVSGIPTWVSLVKTLARNALGRGNDRFVPARARRRVATEARVMLAIYAVAASASAALGSTLLIWVWIVPALLGQPFLRLYLLAEHGRCPYVTNMLQNTRTTFTNAIVRKLAWNMPYHAEHHAYPAVPYHRLPAFHALARTHLAETETGYAAFHAKYVAALAR